MSEVVRMWEVVIGGLYKIEAKTQEEAKSKAVAQFEEEIGKAVADGHSSSFLSHLNKGVYYINVKEKIPGLYRYEEEADKRELVLFFDYPVSEAEARRMVNELKSRGKIFHDWDDIIDEYNYYPEIEGINAYTTYVFQHSSRCRCEWNG